MYIVVHAGIKALRVQSQQTYATLMILGNFLFKTFLCKTLKNTQPTVKFPGKAGLVQDFNPDDSINSV